MGKKDRRKKIDRKNREWRKKGTKWERKEQRRKKEQREKWKKKRKQRETEKIEKKIPSKVPNANPLPPPPDFVPLAIIQNPTAALSPFLSLPRPNSDTGDEVTCDLLRAGRLRPSSSSIYIDIVVGQPSPTDEQLPLPPLLLLTISPRHSWSCTLWPSLLPLLLRRAQRTTAFFLFEWSNFCSLFVYSKGRHQPSSSLLKLDQLSTSTSTTF